MIQAKDLRIGNLLKLKGFENLIRVNQFLGTETIEIKGLYSDYYDENNNNLSDYEYVELSYNVFKLLGFTCLEDEDELGVYEKDFDSIDDTIEFLQIEHCSNEFHFVNCTFDVVIRYAHELQNLVYYLTGIELQPVS
jgi:hypothetical protein